MEKKKRREGKSRTEPEGSPQTTKPIMNFDFNTKTDGFDSFQTPSTCPSLSPNFASQGSSPSIDLNGDRGSISAFDMSLMLLSTKTSPWEMIDMNTSSGQRIECTPAGMEPPGAFLHNDFDSEDRTLHWLGRESKQSPPEPYLTFGTPHHRPTKQSSRAGFLPLDQGLVAGAAIESSLSRPIFPHPEPFGNVVADQMPRWRASMMQTPPRTVAPSATFHPSSLRRPLTALNRQRLPTFNTWIPRRQQTTSIRCLRRQFTHPPRRQLPSRRKLSITILNQL